MPSASVRSSTPSCSCKAPGQTWADALKNIDDKAAAEQQGDIIVTDESAKKMSRPQQTKATPARRGTVGDHRTRPRQRRRIATAAPSDASSDSKQIRTVGPTFIPAR